MDQDISVQIAQIAERQQQMQADQTEMRTDIREIYGTLKGNGQPGICTRMALVEASQGRIWWAVSVVASGVIGVAAWVGRGLIGG